MTNHPDTPDTPDLSDRSDVAGVLDRSDTPDLSDRPALSVAEAAAVLGVNERTVRRHIEKGKLAADRALSDRHTVELRISQAVLADYLGRRSAVEHEAHLADTLPDSLSDRPAPLAGRPVDMPALIAAIGDRLDAQYEARLADKDSLIDELRRRAEVAEREADQLRRVKRQMPWWVRVLLRGQ